MSKSRLAFAFVCFLAGCNQATVTPAGHSDAAIGSGGVPASGGATSAGTGGTAATGGQRARGGAGGSGGVGAGGVVASGGAVGGANAGGSAGTASGGKSGAGGIVASGGSTAKGGSTGSGGAASGGAAAGGATSKGGSSGSGGSTSSTSALNCNTMLPAATSSTTVSATIPISGTKDYAMQRFCADPNSLGPGDQTENQKPVFLLAANAVLKNVIIGGSGCSAADGVHCESGSCTLENVWFGDVGEDAITFKGSNASQVMTINGGGAFNASDKTIQHNGPGTIKISNFYVNTAGKLYRSCGNCGTQYARHVVLDHVVAKGVKWLVGINANYNDTATFANITLCGGGTVICEKYQGNDTGAEPTTIGSGADGTTCIYTNADITQM